MENNIVKFPILEDSRKGAEGLLYLARKTPSNKAKIEMRRHAKAILELVAMVEKIASEELTAESN